MDKPNDMPAFPSNISNDFSMLARGIHQGMTLRDYFAGQIVGHIFSCADGVTNITRDDVVAEVYKIANQMLIEREKHGK